jgi:hypothetical protein
LSGLNACDLSNRGVLLINGQGLLTDGRGLLIDKGILVCILSSRGIAVCNLRFRRAPAYKIDPEVALARSLSLIEWIGYKARDPVEFEGGKGSPSSDLFLDLLPIPFC